MIEWYVGFWPSRNTSLWARLGHVEVWGYTEDDVWVFLDPQAVGLMIDVTYMHDEVEAHLAKRFANCSEIWRLSERRELTFPVMAPLCCPVWVGHVLGIRAFTLRGLRRKLRAIGAEKIHENSGGKPGRQEGPRDGAPARDRGTDALGTEQRLEPHV